MSKTINKYTGAESFFDDLKKEILKVDPVAFCESYLNIDGKPLKLNETGWRFFADMYRYIALEAITPNGKPIVCVKGRQVGCTTMATALELYFCTSGLFGTSPNRPPIRILHCFPSLALVQRFAKLKLGPMMRESTKSYVMKQALSLDEETGKQRRDVPENTQTEKLFKNENFLVVESNANDAQRLHGMTLDCIFYDEAQRMNQDDIGNSNKTLTAARYGPRGKGIQLYFGTPENRGANFHKIWESSDKRLYHLKCSNCNEYFKLYTPEADDWEQVWLYGNVVACRHCGHHQDKNQAAENGKWIPTQTVLSNGQEPQYIGFHFNQLLIPYFTKETILKEKPGIHPTNSDRTWRTQILGEFYSGSDLPMSLEDIYQYCRNINKKISFGSSYSVSSPNPKVLAPYQAPVFMGIDWGSKNDNSESSGGKSFSSVVIVSADKNGTLNIENAFKLKQNDFEHKKAVINEMFRRYNIKIAVADLGHGADIVPELQKEYGGRVLGCWNSGSLTNPVKYDQDELHLLCNPHVILEELFGNMKKSKVLFPWQSYEQIQWLVEHCCSMEKETRTVQGRVITRFVKGNTPNDGLMALMLSYLAYKFYLTQGFTVKAYQIGKKSTGPVLAYLPNM
ncbi:MAG: phage terminase large subunit family protein [Patescibacteria group bacterium]